MDTTLVFDSLQNLDSLVVNLTIQPQITNVISENRSLFSNPVTFVAIVAVAVSIITLIITTWYNRKTLKLTKVHNRLIVKPLFCFERHLSDDKKTIYYKLVNTGFGPAILKTLEYSYNNTTYSNIFKIIIKEASDIYYNGVKRKKIEFVTLNDEPSIKEKGEIFLYKIPLNTERNVIQLEHFLKKVKATIKYSSLYDDDYEIFNIKD